MFDLTRQVMTVLYQNLGFAARCKPAIGPDARQPTPVFSQTSRDVEEFPLDGLI